jgi:hypothetical protein
MPFNRNSQAAQDILDVTTVYQVRHVSEPHVEVHGLNISQTRVIKQVLPLNKVQLWQDIKSNDIMTKARSLARSNNPSDLVRPYGYYVLSGTMVMSNFHLFLNHWEDCDYRDSRIGQEQGKAELEIELCSELGILFRKLDHPGEALIATYVASSLARRVSLAADEREVLDKRVNELLLAETSWGSVERDVEFILGKSPWSEIGELQEAASQIRDRRRALADLQLTKTISIRCCKAF